jgi:L-threonylcarbamoyladenylate synthase
MINLKEYKNIALLSDKSEEDLEYAAKLIRNGELVGIPTETVYGLGANALDKEAVKKIFNAKGRPCDNPLIVHICSTDMLSELVEKVPETAKKLMEKFWPGPLTIIMPKSDLIPYETSGGLETVGIRMPASEFTRNLIKKSGVPIAAPSANVSGYPSPTEALHVCRDMQGKIKAVVDGGKCSVGLESTVIAFDSEDVIRILRPGYITDKDLAPFAKEVIIDKAIINGLDKDEKAASPGMKYKHYSPKADVVLVEGNSAEFEEFSKTLKPSDGLYVAAFDGELENSSLNVVNYGKDTAQQAQNLFALLRKLDEIKAEKVYVHAPDKVGIGLAIYNRLIRAAGFEVIRL